MACLTFPNTGLVPGVTTYVADNVTYLWDGTVWEAITAPLAARQITFDSTGNVKDKIDENTSVNKAQLIAQGYTGDYGFFERGFAYVSEGDVGVDSEGRIWKYTGSGAPSKVVSAGTVPSTDTGYDKVVFNAASGVIFENGTNVQEFRNYTTLNGTVSSVAGGKFSVGDTVTVTDRARGVFCIETGTSSNGYDVLPAGTNKIAILDVSNGYVADHFGAKGDATLDAEGNVIAGYSSNYKALNRIIEMMGRAGGKITFNKGKYDITGWDVDSPNVIIEGQGVASTFLIGLGGGTALNVQPKYNGHPYTAKGSSGFIMRDLTLYAGDELARSSGTGIYLTSVLVGKFESCNLLGFQDNIKQLGCHYTKFDQCYNANEIIKTVNPNYDSHNRGSAIHIVDATSPAGEPLTTAVFISGGWYSNTHFNLDNSSNVSIHNIDLEPGNKTSHFLDGTHIYDCRLERIDLFALSPYNQYDRFPWFIFKGTNNTFENNDIHSGGTNNRSHVNPKIIVEGDYNTFKFKDGTATTGLIDLSESSRGNVIEVGRFRDFIRFKREWPLNFGEANTGIFDGDNDFKLKNDGVDLIKRNRTFLVEGEATSIPLPNAETIQGATGFGGSFTITGSASDNRRIILNYATENMYETGFYYAIKFKLTCDSGVGITARISYLVDSYSGETSTIKRDGDWVVWRFFIPTGQDSLKIEPSIQFSGEVGKTFSIGDFELLKLGEGEYVETPYSFVEETPTQPSPEVELTD